MTRLRLDYAAWGLASRNDDGSLALEVTVADAGGRPCAQATAEFVPLDAGRAGRAIGAVAGAGFVAG